MIWIFRAIRAAKWDRERARDRLRRRDIIGARRAELGKSMDAIERALRSSWCDPQLKPELERRLMLLRADDLILSHLTPP
jgi:hypothetical protein